MVEYFCPNGLPCLGARRCKAAMIGNAAGEAVKQTIQEYPFVKDTLGPKANPDLIAKQMQQKAAYGGDCAQQNPSQQS